MGSAPMHSEGLTSRPASEAINARREDGFAVASINAHAGVEHPHPQVATIGAVKPTRIPSVRLPDVQILADETTVQRNPDYPAAKAGDLGAAARLVKAVLPAGGVQAIRAAVGGERVSVLGVAAVETRGVNEIPQAMAWAVAPRCGKTPLSNPSRRTVWVTRALQGGTGYGIKPSLSATSTVDAATGCWMTL